MHDGRWKAALGRALIICQAGWFVKYAPLEGFVIELCVGSGQRLHTSHRH